MATKGYKGIGMEGSVARYYDRTVKKTNSQDYQGWADTFSGQIPPGSRVLEVAPGPGYLSIELARRGHRVTGLDISQTFVEIASANAREAGVEVEFQQGNASAMPFESNSFDGILCTAAFKNFSDPVGALREMERVLKPGRKAWILDMRRDVCNKAIDDYVKNRMKLSGWEKFSMGLTFKYFLRRRAYTRAQLEAMVAQTPFARYRIEENEIGFELWMEKTG
jgi:ubiquinone/menaquinone biosynthesis C-methylase UbiE